jgi:NADPH:quinone reductase-like Zn-dependent oxidoreductase
MKAVIIREQGPADVLRYEDVPTPTPGPDEVLIDVEAISIEGGDIHARTIIPLPRSPHIIGYLASGSVEAVGANVHGIRLGQRVVGFGFLPRLCREVLRAGSLRFSHPGGARYSDRRIHSGDIRDGRHGPL